MKKYSLLPLILGMALPCSAAPIVTLNSGNMTAAVLFAPDFSSFSTVDIRSDASFLVSDGAPLGIVLTTDLGLPAPNNLVLALNLAITQGGTLTFFPGLATFSPGNVSVSIPVVGTPLVALTEVPIQTVLALTSIQFEFTSFIFSDQLAGHLALYSFVSATGPAIPEPGTMGVAAFALVAAGFAGRRTLQRR